MFGSVLHRWPQLAGLWETDDYATYCRMLDAAMVDYARGATPRLVPIEPDRLAAWADRQRIDPGSEQARAGYAADQLRHGATGPAWPPGPDGACWCGSGRRYRHCCRSSGGSAFHRPW